MANEKSVNAACRRTWHAIAVRMEDTGITLEARFGPRALEVLQRAMQDCSKLIEDAFGTDEPGDPGR